MVTLFDSVLGGPLGVPSHIPYTGPRWGTSSPLATPGTYCRDEDLYSRRIIKPGRYTRISSGIVEVSFVESVSLRR